MLCAGMLSAAERTIDDFSASGKCAWRVVAKGGNLDPLIQAGYEDEDGVISLRFGLRFRDPEDKRGDRRWLIFDYPLSPDESWRGFDGIAFDVRCETGGTDFLMPVLWAGTNICYRPTQEWSGVPRQTRWIKTEQMGPIPERWTTFRMPFGKTDPAKLTHLRLSGGAGNSSATDILFRNMRLYAAARGRVIAPCVTMTVDPKYVGNPSNVFQPGQRVSFSLEVDKAPADMAALEWEIQDNDRCVVATGRIDAAGDGRHDVELNPLPSGYYETRVRLLGGDGRRLSDESVLRTSGTMPKGVQSFAVVPCPYHETIARMARGTDEFFGVMNSRDGYRVAELTGAPWSLSTVNIEWNKAEGVPNIKPKAPWHRRVMSFTHYANTNAHYRGPSINPAKMRAGGPDAELYKKWIAAMVRGNVRALPHMDKRPYELCWEPDLQCPPFGNLKIEDLVEWMRIVRDIVKENDPKAVIWGPKCTHNMLWYEKALEAGIGKYIDAISMHLYTGPVPENDNMPQRLRRIRSLARRHTGRDLQVNNTESGCYRQIDVQTQAKKIVRYATILKGEGVRTFLLFYIFDFWEYGHIADYGLFYNPTWPLNHGPKQIYPKPLLPAYATLTKFLTNRRATACLGDAAKGFFGYAFTGENETVLVLWSPYRTERVVFPVCGHGVTVTDLMGVDRYVKAEDGFVTLAIDDSPVYVRGAETSDGGAPEVTRVARAVEFLGASPESRKGEGAFVARFTNTTDRVQEVPVSLSKDDGRLRQTLRIAAKEEGECAFALGGACRTDRPLKGRLGWRVDGTRYAEPVEANFLRAFRLGEKDARKGPFSNLACIRGKGLDGTPREAELRLFHSDKGLHVEAVVADPVHSQSYPPESMWMADSLQLAFDTAPGYAYEYDEAIMQTRKKVSDIIVGLTPQGMRVFRNRTYSTRFLPTGEISLDRFAGSSIVRKDGKTVYDIVIPWTEMGLGDGERPSEIGFALLVNDRDHEKGKTRAFYGLFGGIADGTLYRNYGRLVLE